MAHLQTSAALLGSLVLRHSSKRPTRHRFRCRRLFHTQCREDLRLYTHSSKRSLATCPCLGAPAIPPDLLKIRYRKVCLQWRHPVSTSQSTEDLRSHHVHKPGLTLGTQHPPSTASKAQARSKPKPCTTAARTCRTTTSRLSTTVSATCG